MEVVEDVLLAVLVELEVEVVLRLVEELEVEELELDVVVLVDTEELEVVVLETEVDELEELVVVLDTVEVVVVEAMHSYCAKYMNSQPRSQTRGSLLCAQLR